MGVRNKQITWDSPVDLGGQAVLNAGSDPSLTSLITRQDALGLVSSSRWKTPGALVATVDDAFWAAASLSFGAGELTISNLPTGAGYGLIDGIQPGLDSRILVKDAGVSITNADPVFNGIWRVDSGTNTSLVLVRDSDADDADKLIGAAVIVEQGTSASKIFVQTELPSVINSDAVQWSLPKADVDALDVFFDNTGTGLSGSDLQAVNVELDSRLAVLEAGPFTIDSFSIPSTDFGSGALVEVGATVNEVNFLATYSQVLTAAELDDGGGPLTVPLPATSFSYTGIGGASSFVNTGINDTQSFLLDVDDDFGRSAVDSILVTWAARIYYGNAVPPVGVIDEAFIEALEFTTGGNPLRVSKNGAFNVVAGPTEKIYFCYPDTFGLSTFFVGGFEGGFFDEGVFPVTNAQGILINYRVYSSDNLDLGDTDFTVT